MMLESEIRLIQNENSTLRNDFEKQSHDFFHLEKKMKNEISNEMKRLSDEKDEAIQVKYLILHIIDNLSKIMSTQGKEHEALKLIYGKLALNHKALCSSMKILKEKLENQQRKNSDLMNENQNLKIKAGVAWGDLTPRPSFEKVDKNIYFNYQ